MANVEGLEDARTVFSSLPTRDIVTWDAMIAGYTEHEEVEEALYCRVPSLVANQATFASLLKACTALDLASIVICMPHVAG